MLGGVREGRSGMKYNTDIDAVVRELLYQGRLEEDEAEEFIEAVEYRIEEGDYCCWDGEEE